jgi:carbon monoxide dehydrogenase subunit G
MRVEGTYRFPASQERVYALLLDPTVLAGCIPGCERLEAAGEDHYEATVKVGVGAVRGTYKGDVRIVDQQAPEQYRMLVQGRGGPGFIKGEASVRIVPAGDAECDVQVVGDGQVGGMIAGVAQRLLGGVATMMMNQFFECLRGKASQANGEASQADG